ncbi:hypothetical protein [Streptomyces hydrogenans]
MSDRPRLDQLTDDMLDQLYAELWHLRLDKEGAGLALQAAVRKTEEERRRAEKAEAAIARVRNWCDQLDTRTCELTGDPASTNPIAQGIRIVLDLPA